MIAIVKRIVWYCLLFCLISFSVNAKVETEDKAEAAVTRSAESQAYHDQIQAVLAQKTFGEKKKVKSWRLKDQKKKNQEKPELPKWLKDFFESLGASTGFVYGFARTIEILLWGILIAVVVYLLVKYRALILDYVSQIGIRQSADSSLPTTMFGLDVQKTSIPKDVISSAQALWQTGEHRQAIALLLRASLIKLLHEHHCFFLDSDTEAECCKRLDKQVNQRLSQYMRFLVKVWQQLAYAHRAPTDAVFRQLCLQWQEVF